MPETVEERKVRMEEDEQAFNAMRGICGCLTISGFLSVAVIFLIAAFVILHFFGWL